MYPKEIKWEEVDWIDSDQDRDLWRDLTNAVIKHRFTQNAGEFLGVAG